MRQLERTKNPATYISNIEESEAFDLSNITVEHRSNNPKRDYLFVNKLQCKHIPVSGVKMVDMCKQLARQLNGYFMRELTVNDKILVIAFAETATAIGNIVADNLLIESYVMQTTREDVQHSKELINFEEEHSHATTQKLLINEEADIDRFIKEFKVVLFVEDEISTGNTILNFISKFRNIAPNMNYVVASICNWQSEENKEKFNSEGIKTFALLRGELNNTNAKMVDADKIVYDIDVPDYTHVKQSELFYYKPCNKLLGKDLFEDERLGHFPNRDLTRLYNKVDEFLSDHAEFKSVRVVGTEEFMYIPIKVAEYIEKTKGISVICHSTTRSPIDVMYSANPYDYSEAIVSKVRIPSVYEDTRDTYLYNTDVNVDLTIMVTDGNLTDKKASQYYELFSKTSKYVLAYEL